MAIFTGDDRPNPTSEYDKAVDGQAAFGRFEPIVTVQQLKDRYLFGIPLVAALPDPITKQRAVVTDDLLKDAIGRACASVESEVGAGFHITPVKIKERLPFDRAEYKALGFFRCHEAPILRVQSLVVETVNAEVVYRVPVQWVDPGQFNKGQFNIIPLVPAFVGAGAALPSYDAGGSVWLSILGQSGWVASYFGIEYIAGMDEGHIPLVVNEMIGLTAAIDILGKLAATYRIASYSTGLDAASQSVSTPGVGVYDGAIQRMQEEKDKKLGKIKVLYYKKIFCGNV